MSHKDKKYHWRTTHCDGCEHNCCYRDFAPLADDDIRFPLRRRDTVVLHRKKRGLRIDGALPSRLFTDFQQRVPCGESKHRTNVLGLMHEFKRELWRKMTAECPLREDNNDPYSVL